MGRRFVRTLINLLVLAVLRFRGLCRSISIDQIILYTVTVLAFNGQTERTQRKHERRANNAIATLHGLLLVVRVKRRSVGFCYCFSVSF